jgi:hypothetical protein
MLLPLLTLLQAAAPATVPPAHAPPIPVYDGAQRQLAVAIPRLEGEIVVDGVLDEPVWSGAAVLAGFSHFQPIDRVPAADSTEVLVWYSPTAIHFGVRAREPHGEVHASLADRDRIFADDYLQIFLGTFNDGRQAFMFAVNPLGVQADGVLVERGITGGGGFSSGVARAREGADLSPDFVFASKGRLVPGGYEVEFRIPFKSLRYQAGASQTWQLHVLRQIQHSGFEDSWVPAERASASFLAQSGRLAGLTGLERGLALDITPEITSRLDGAPGGAGWDYDRVGPELGGNVRLGLTNDLTLNGTANPDFSQVEADVTQIQFDPRDALFFSEKRPFFLDGLELFQTPNNLVYTRRVVQPAAAVKLTGRLLGADVGFISAVDDTVASLTRDAHPVVNVLRAQRNLGGRSKVGLVYTDRIDGDQYNRVGALDARLVFGKSNLTLQYGQSRTHEAGRTYSGPIWNARFTHNGRLVGARWNLNGISPQFRTRSGFISRVGDVNLSLVNLITLNGKPGSLVESFTPDISLIGRWSYDDFTGGGGLRDQLLHFNLNTRLRGGWSAGASLLLEKFGYDPRLYRGYTIEVPGPGGVGLDTIPFTGVPKIPNRDWVLTAATPQYAGFSADAFVLWGQDENFFEWASATLLSSSVGVNWRPTDQLRVEGRYRENRYQRRTDGSLVGRQRIPRVKVEYQLARPLFVRVVAEYNAYQQDSLRDDTRTNGVILINGQRTQAFTDNIFRGDVLLSFTPTPGTVFFAGYGSTVEDGEAFRFRDVRRRADGFFLKGSYLFRFGG